MPNAEKLRQAYLAEFRREPPDDLDLEAFARQHLQELQGTPLAQPDPHGLVYHMQATDPGCDLVDPYENLHNSIRAWKEALGEGQ